MNRWPPQGDYKLTLLHHVRGHDPLGLLDGLVVSIVHTESPRLIRIISFRKATKREQAIYFNGIKD